MGAERPVRSTGMNMESVGARSCLPLWYVDRHITVEGKTCPNQ